MYSSKVTNENLQRVFNRPHHGVIPVVDSASMMEPGFFDFLENRVFPLLDGRKLYLCTSTLHEFRSLSTSATVDPGKKRRAQEALIYLEKHSDMFAIAGRETDGAFTDAYIVGLLPKILPLHHLIVFSEDNGLLQSCLGVYEQLNSCVRHKRSLCVVNFSKNYMKTIYEDPQKPHETWPSTPTTSGLQSTPVMRPNASVFQKPSHFELNFPDAKVFTKDGNVMHLGGMLGSGAVARVFEVSATTAAKIIHPDLDAPQYQEFFERTVKLMRKGLAHDHVVFPQQLLFDSAGNAVGYSMRKLSNACSLHTLLSAHGARVTYRDRVAIAYQLADALCYLEDNAAIDVPDLRLDNILVVENKAYLIDPDGFSVEGVAEEKSDNVLYGPPKRYSVQNKAAFRFAILSCQLICGRHPFLQPGVGIRESIDCLDFKPSSDFKQNFESLPDDLRFSYERSFKGYPPSLEEFKVLLGKARDEAEKPKGLFQRWFH